MTEQPSKDPVEPEIMGEGKHQSRAEVARRKGIKKVMVQPAGPAFYHQLATALNANVSVQVQS